jgi:hypothetical protein
MADIVTTRIFQDGEKNITAQKLNDIVASSTIQPAFVSSKPSTSTIATTDNLLVLQTAGTYAKAPFQTVIDSVSAGINSDAEIWNVRLRSFNAIGNPTFEVDQRNAGIGITAIANGAFIQDRWTYSKVGTMVVNANPATPTAAGAEILIPGTNYNISRCFTRLTLTTAEASLAAGDYIVFTQSVEGPNIRELFKDVHSFQILCRSTVANLKFGICFRDPGPASKSLTKLCSLGAANTWSLITLPGLPVFPSGNFTTAPGANGLQLSIALGVGTTLTSPANDTWQNGNFLGAAGQDNFAGKPVNSTFDVAFVQHEPGPVCSTPMDCPFTQNLDACLRYYCKSYDYDVAVGAVTNLGQIMWWQQNTTVLSNGIRFPKAMAKIPTVTHYNTSTGAANSVNFGGTNYATSSIINLGKGGFNGITTATLPAVVAGATAPGQYTADTGW